MVLGATDPSGLTGGFPVPVFDAQSTFRAVLEAMARPGTVQSLPILPQVPAPLSPAAGAICLALADLDTPVWIDRRDAVVRRYLRFHCGCPLTDDPSAARFAVLTAPADLADWDLFDIGTTDYPDRSTTLIVRTDRLEAGHGKRLTGPGIETAAWLSALGLPDGMWRALERNRALFPLGIDVILVDQDRVAGLPRSVRIEG